MNKISCTILAWILTFALYYIPTSKPVELIENADVTPKHLETDSLLEPIHTIEELEEKEKTVVETEITETEVVETEIEENVINPYAKELLACVIYQEAGSDLQCDDCRRRVADVVLNRVESDLFPNTIYEVLTQQYQYGLYYYTGVVWPKRASDPNESEAVERAYRIAEEVLEGKHSELYGKDYIWQAEFTQGINNIYCCGIYFGQLDKEG